MSKTWIVLRLGPGDGVLRRRGSWRVPPGCLRLSAGIALATGCDHDREANERCKEYLHDHVLGNGKRNCCFKCTSCEGHYREKAGIGVGTVLHYLKGIPYASWMSHRRETHQKRALLSLEREAAPGSPYADPGAGLGVTAAPPTAFTAALPSP